MESFRIHKGTVAVLMNDNIDTDQIIPKQYLKRIERTGFGQFLFDEWRYNNERQENLDFPLNAPERKGASILVTGDNFGCGSSREHAPWALADYGFRVIIAGGFADIFYMNCMKNGMLPIVMGKEMREELASIDPRAVIEVDLENEIIITPENRFYFTIENMWKEKLLKGLDEIGITMQYEQQIQEYEQKIAHYIF
ncbi:3-isopropylmalate dehydratase small subunit [Bacillus pseudomycoides]|uniref:3-isopropylmalate dehydratase small subunit n=1 Tax=Bacillus pseudomycoides TaxID=64104 RepID=A0AA91VFF2_9BACI|nr:MULTISPECIES: 3-isopropylmalate dehydratase small subunit [Bacillus]PEB52718.1 3-isopropylmalate dehydratase small subunit [Bacillus sp. AFS098217]PED83180.1 3-isopropylmalate dehydratase small subunit [Bacillus pseudomycoides]PEU14033.1 3-isopropylmalate dehydratase small subunit [Bacillus sp. AFS019443]PEU17649.1 3-isopropylmalate dehydratase small subunit [Bacillus sp. AFS014408]PFW62335.1 3-isopropylmalate dehydratase small subunit [Bacillus sp. AFS075034]